MKKNRIDIIITIIIIAVLLFNQIGLYFMYLENSLCKYYGLPDEDLYFNKMSNIIIYYFISHIVTLTLFLIHIYVSYPINRTVLDKNK
jgi:hypothetical protein